MILLFSACLFVGDDELADFVDGDGDGHADIALGGDDCADNDTAITTGETVYRDADGDTFGDAATEDVACTVPDGWVTNGSDCDDGDASLSTSVTLYEDADGDGWGGTETQERCSDEPGWTSTPGDCDDAAADINPGALEVARDYDADCDGEMGDGALENVGIHFIDDYPGAEIGRSGAGIGDAFGGDGRGDVAIGLPLLDRLVIARGTENFGDPGDVQAVLLSSATTAWTGDTGSQAGASVAPGDFNADGSVDLVVGAPGFDGAGAFVVFNYPYGEPTLVPDTTIGGGVLDDEFGATVATGDVDGDGGDDVLVAATGDPVVHAVYGPFDDRTLRDITFVQDARFDLGRTRTGGGPLTLASADADGDGVEEVYIGAPWSDVERAGAGAVWVCPGEGSSGVDDCVGWYGAVAADAFGTSIAADDLEGDGYADLLVGAPGASGGEGAAYIFRGDPDVFNGSFGGTSTLAAATLQAEVRKTDDDPAVGTSVAIVGDMDGNEQLDIAIGAPAAYIPGEGPNAGATYILFGLLPDGTHDLSAATDRFVCFFGECASGTFVAPAGDIDGDGFPDVLSGSPGWLYNGSVETGALSVIFAFNVD